MMIFWKQSFVVFNSKPMFFELRCIFCFWKLHAFDKFRDKINVFWICGEECECLRIRIF